MMLKVFVVQLDTFSGEVLYGSIIVPVLNQVSRRLKYVEDLLKSFYSF